MKTSLKVISLLSLCLVASATTTKGKLKSQMQELEQEELEIENSDPMTLAEASQSLTDFGTTISVGEVSNIALKSFSGKFLGTRPDGSSYFIEHRDIWETYAMTLQDDGTYTFKDYHGKYVAVKSDLTLGDSTDVNIFTKFWITRKAN